MDTVAATFEACFNMTASPLFFPVRHHSPAVSFHLEKVLDTYQPDLVLIEGPSDTNHLLEHLGNAENQAPLCIYYSYSHKGAAPEDRFKSSCYYPLLDFSPELVAIRWTAEKEIPCRFIDLPYSQLSLTTRQQSLTPNKTEPDMPKADPNQKESYYDDYHLARSKYIASLCAKQGLRDYSELWEKLFEIQGLEMESRQFVKALYALCHYSRVEYPPKLLAAEGCLAREVYMAGEIQKVLPDYKRILVVTGGFHSAALQQLIQTPQPVMKVAKGAESYLIPYSFAESDQLSGYASGMPYPAFYQQVFEYLQAGEGEPYNKAVLTMLAQIGGKLRRHKEAVSIADEAVAYLQAKGLAELRNKHQQGVYELLDGVRSAYVKGPLDLSTTRIIQLAQAHLRGEKMGTVAAEVEQVPLLLDFKQQAKKHRLQIDRVVRNETILEILAKPTHRQASVLFHRLEFLQVGFGRLLAGPNYRQRDAQRVRERWDYVYNAKVEAALIDVSFLGGTVREAASAKLARQRQDGLGCGEYTKMLIDAAVMDLTEHAGALIQITQEAVSEDGSFFSLTEAGENLLFLENARWLLDVAEMTYVAELIDQVYTKSVSLLPDLRTSQEEQDRQLAKRLKGLYQLAQREGVEERLLYEGLLDLCAQNVPPPCIHGSAAGLLYGGGVWTGAEVLTQAEAYLYGTEDKMKQSGLFLGGLFLSAWDLLFAEAGFLSGLANVLKALDQDDFLKVLPDLRLAFSTFTPTQTDRIAAVVAANLGLGVEQLKQKPVAEAVLRLGQHLDQYALAQLKGGESDG